MANNWVDLATVPTTTSITSADVGPYTDINTFTTRTSITYDERGPFTDAGTVIGTTTELLIEVANTVDFGTVESMSGFDATSVETYQIHTHDYNNNPWDVTVVSDNTSYPTAGLIGTAGDDGAIT